MFYIQSYLMNSQKAPNIDSVLWVTVGMCCCSLQLSHYILTFGTSCHDLYLSLHIILPIFSIILALYLTILPLLVIVPPFWSLSSPLSWPYTSNWSFYPHWADPAPVISYILKKGLYTSLARISCPTRFLLFGDLSALVSISSPSLYFLL